MDAKELRIADYFGYKIREDGVIFSKVDGEPMKPSLSEKKYFQINLTVNSKHICRKVHQLVALMFIPNPLNKKTVNHLDFDKLNNLVSNLEWATQQEQIAHAAKAGRMKGYSNDFHGEKNPRSIVTESDVRKIRELSQTTKMTLPEIGKMFSINRFTASNIIHKRTWKHVI